MCERSVGVKRLDTWPADGVMLGGRDGHRRNNAVHLSAVKG